MDGALIAVLRPRGPRPRRHLQDGGRRAAAERLSSSSGSAAITRRSTPASTSSCRSSTSSATGTRSRRQAHRHPGAGLHHARQRAGRRGRRPLPEGAEPRARLVRHLRTTSSPSRSWRRRRCAARSARSISIARSRSARPSTSQVVGELDKASEPWGVKVLRYEIKNIQPPADILAAMEKQMRAEREKRAVILTSEGQRDAAINTAEGEKQQVIKASEAKRQQQINEAEGQASAILRRRHRPRREGIREVADAIRSRRRHGSGAAARRRAVRRAVRQSAQKTQHGRSCRRTVSDVAGMIAAAMKVFNTSTPPPFSTPPRPTTPPPPPTAPPR